MALSTVGTSVSAAADGLGGVTVYKSERASERLTKNRADGRAAMEAYHDMRSSSRRIKEDFARFDGGTEATGRFEGAAGKAFAGLISDLDVDLVELPRVANEGGKIFSDYELKLSQLERRANDALANARALRHKEEAARTGLKRLDGEIVHVSNQLSALHATNAEGRNDSEIERVTDRSRHLNAQHKEIDSDLRTTTGKQQELLREINSIESEERALYERVAANLRSIDLRDIKDPGKARRMFDAAVELNKALAEFAFEAGYYLSLGPAVGEALAHLLVNQDWQTSLWVIRDGIDRYSNILALASYMPLGNPIAELTVGAVADLLSRTTWKMDHILQKADITDSRNPGRREDLSLARIAGSGLLPGLGILGLYGNYRHFEDRFAGASDRFDQIRNTPTGTVDMDALRRIEAINARNELRGLLPKILGGGGGEGGHGGMRAVDPIPIQRAGEPISLASTGAMSTESGTSVRQPWAGVSIEHHWTVPIEPRWTIPQQIDHWHVEPARIHVAPAGNFRSGHAVAGTT